MNHLPQVSQGVTGLWVGDTLPIIPRLCMSSFIQNDIPFQLFTYQSYSGIPEGVYVRDAREILPESDIFKTQSGSYAHFSDWFRYKWLYEEGGFWVDMDIICLNSNVPSAEFWCALENKDTVGTATIKAPQNHAIMYELMNLAQDPATIMSWDSSSVIRSKASFKRSIEDISERRISSGWGYAGPDQFTQALKYYHLEDVIAPPHTIYPIPYFHWKNIYQQTLDLDQMKNQGTWGVHLWTEMLRLSDQNCLPFLGTYKELMNKYLPEF